MSGGCRSESSRRSSTVREGEGYDEEELMWVALQRLPTQKRVTKGFLVNEEFNDGGGRRGIVDVQMGLGAVERKLLVDRLVGAEEGGNEGFLRKLKNRVDRVGIELPTVEIRFENLNIVAEAYVGSRGLPSVTNFFLDKITGALSYLRIIPSGKMPISIIHDASGIIKPNRMTLLLGPPGSGKTTLLLALAGKLHSSLKVSGRVSYNGYDLHEFVPQRTASYIGQNDLHIGEMTVRETLNFSARCQGVGTRYDMLTELSRREKEQGIKPDPDVDVFMKATSMQGQEKVATEYIIKMLGLEACADTLVGDAMRRGISGGQKKRVTIGEMLVGPAKAYFMDEISNGLDSSTTYQMVDCIRQSVHILGGTAFVALLQPAPETYELFDNIAVLSEGRIVYQGPKEFALEFFELMGFKCPERKGVADFLHEVTSRKDQGQYWNEKEPYRYVSVDEFTEAFKQFHVGRKLEEELASPFDRKQNHPAALTTSKYGTSKLELMKACISREWLLMKRNSLVYIFKLIQMMLLGIIGLSVFPRDKMHRDSVEDGEIFLGAMFIGLLTHLFNGFAELAMTVVKLPIFYKQRDLFFFPSWAYGLPIWVLKIPISFLECAIWIAITYYSIGFDPNISRFFKHYLLLVLVSQMASGLFRLFAALGRNKVVADTLVAFTQMLILLFGGFFISKEKMKKWWVWAYWSSPMMYAYNAISVNEFLGQNWNKESFFLVNVGETRVTIGVQILKARGIFVDANWYWIGAGAMIGYIMLFNLVFIIFLRWLDPPGKGQRILSEEEIRERQANKRGEEEPEDSNLVSRTDSARMTAKPTYKIMPADMEKKKTVALPFAPLWITFQDIRYSVDMPKEMKENGVVEDRLVLLQGVSGAFRPGVLTALMGISGAGKTTLMDVLAGRKTGGFIEGSISISGYPKNQETFARISGYCEQNDIHSPHVTVLESLLFSAWLRLSDGIDTNIRKAFVEEVMDLVELSSLREALVGLPGVNGLSTEQRKRLTIAVELVANPSIIFMDEPTSGLDARAAAIVMRTVRNTVDTGRTVVCTIHQPSIDILESFDELFLMKRGGEAIYVGPLGLNSCNLIEYFEGIEGIRKIKNGYNPATWMLEETSEAREHLLGVNFSEIYQYSDLFKRNKALIEELSEPALGSRDLFFPTKYSQPTATQFAACLWKQHWSYWRNPSYTAVRIFFNAVSAAVFGTAFSKIGQKVASQQDLLNSLGCLYGAAMFIGVQNGNSVQPVVHVERTVFYRERAAGMYSSLPYAFAQVAIEIPHVLLQTLIYGAVVYRLIDFEWSAVKFFYYLFFMFFTFLYFTLYGMMVVSMTPNSDVAAIFAAAFYFIWNVFAGYLIPRPRIPGWWRWYTWACPVAWSLRGLATSQYGDNKTEMEIGITVEGFLEDFFGFHRDSLWASFIAVVGFNLLFAFTFAFCIKYLNFQKR